MLFGVSARKPGTGVTARHVGAGMLLLAAVTSLSGCGSNGIIKSNVVGGLNETYHAGFVMPDNGLEQIPIGASRDQVQIVLGSPSTTADFGGEVWYYISQTRTRKVLFANQKIVEQRVLAIYFDKKNNIERIGNYGLKDGKVFDFVSQTTPTGGKDQGFLEQILTGALNVGSPLGG
ncbi:outer membrane protein assembly factor BamE [Kaistia algarum]|uniref:outer membrane protein assembly factor BamE n=1 Tax=Kaistia algarum TaxID=2083279 RepID=UPI00225743A1|nr:outer membrane protein assembly factor BamE [Kaistia algarum]MCX5514973.1 outer membrane protein assembly factor BamE [Kaistia algarum]